MTEHSVRTRALIAAGKQVAHARGDDGSWRLEVFVDAVLAVTEADKAEAVVLKAFVRDLATHGIRFDLNPTLDTRDPLATDRYVGRIDMDIRTRAVRALSDATVAAPTEENS